RCYSWTTTTHGSSAFWTGGELDANGKLVLGHPVNTTTAAMNGIVVPPGIGLGGQILLSGRPAWVTNYPNAASLTHPFSAQADLEGLKGMVPSPSSTADGARCPLRLQPVQDKLRRYRHQGARDGRRTRRERRRPHRTGSPQRGNRRT